jgi:hypothetical protein
VFVCQGEAREEESWEAGCTVVGNSTRLSNLIHYDTPNLARSVEGQKSGIGVQRRVLGAGLAVVGEGEAHLSRSSASPWKTVPADGRSVGVATPFGRLWLLPLLSVLVGQLRSDYGTEGGMDIVRYLLRRSSGC